MHHGGLEVSRKSAHVHLEDAQGRRVKRAVVTTTLAGLTDAVERYAERGVRVAIEAGHQTSSEPVPIEWTRIDPADLLRRLDEMGIRLVK